MHIGIHTLFLKSGLVGGSETYTRNLVSALGRIDRDNSYAIFVSRQNKGTFQPLPSNFREVIVDRKSTSIIKRTGIDLIHYPGTTIHFGSKGVPAIVTVHDLQHLYWPRFFTWRERFRRWRQDRPSIGKAARIIAVSHFTRRTLIVKFPTAAAKVQTVYSGVDASFRRPVSAEVKQQLRAKYKLPPTFALYPARPWPHKNHRRLIAAMQILHRHYRSDCRLVLCGFAAQETPDAWRSLHHNLIGDTVHIAGYLPSYELPTLYQAANLLIYPSLFEGFGLPVLEAMAAGCPVICTDIASLPEIAGDAALLVDPFDSAAMAAAMHRLLNDDCLRQRQIARGRQRAARFSWEASARATLSIYHQCHSQRKEPCEVQDEPIHD